MTRIYKSGMKVPGPGTSCPCPIQVGPRVVPFRPLWRPFAQPLVYSKAGPIHTGVGSTPRARRLWTGLTEQGSCNLCVCRVVQPVPPACRHGWVVGRRSYQEGRWVSPVSHTCAGTLILAHVCWAGPLRPLAACSRTRGPWKALGAIHWPAKPLAAWDLSRSAFCSHTEYRPLQVLFIATWVTGGTWLSRGAPLRLITSCC